MGKLKKHFVTDHNPDVPKIESKSEIDKKYWSLRLQIIFTTFIGYGIFYLTRKNFAYAMPAMMDDLGLTAIDFGIISTLYYIIYGTSKFINGVCADKFNPRAIFGPALIIVGIANLCIGGSSSVTMIIVFYCINAFFQGSGFPPVAKALSVWYSKNERGTWWSIWDISHNAGGAISPLLTSFVIVLSGSWRMGFYVPGIISIIFGLISLYTMHNSPAYNGLPKVGDWRNDKEEQEIEKTSPRGLSIPQIYFRYIFKNPFMWFGCLGFLGCYITRIAVSDWVSVYYTQEAHWSLTKANSLAFWFEIGGLVGSFFAGIISDFIFKGDRWKVNMLFLFIILGSVISLAFINPDHYYLNVIIFFMIGWGVYGPQVLYAVGLIEITHKDAAGAATGTYGLFTYIGAALSGLPIALIQENFEWKGVYVFLIIMSSLTIFTLLPLIFSKKIGVIK